MTDTTYTKNRYSMHDRQTQHTRQTDYTKDRLHERQIDKSANLKAVRAENILNIQSIHYRQTDRHHAHTQAGA